MKNYIQSFLPIFLSFSFGFGTLSSSSKAGLLSPHIDADGGHHVEIQKEALGKEFLLHVYDKDLVNESTHSATCQALGHDIIVKFIRSGKTVQMLGSTEDVTVDPTLQGAMLLAQFPVIEQSNDSLVLNFNKGMKRFFQTAKLHQGQAGHIDISLSYISEAIEKDSGIQINQIVQYKNQDQASFGEIRYFFSEYKQNAHFSPKESKPEDELYFKTKTPKREASTGRLFHRDMKWSLHKPIHFYLSSNIPAEYRQAAREGVLYWNLAFGKDLIQVFDAPIGVVAPSTDYNMIQWIESGAALMAYADMVSDPRTGEIKHAQVFIPSGLMKKVEIELRAKYRFESNLQSRATHWLNTSEPFSFERLGFSLIRKPYRLERLLNDNFRSLVAHEVGHTLGLKHNFLASKSANLLEREKQSLFTEYLFADISRKLDRSKLSTSVMDYMPMEADILLGAQIGASLSDPAGKALDFDEWAIQELYFDSKHPERNRNFCHDSDADVNGFIDCQRYDFGADAIDYYRTSLESQLEKMPAAIVELYIEAKTERGSDFLPRIALDIVGSVERATIEIAQMLALFNKGSRLKSIEAQFPHGGPTQAKKIKEAKYKAIKESLNRLGGVESVLFFLLPACRNSEASIKNWKQLLDSYLGNNRDGFSYKEKPYQLSDSDVQVIKSELETLFPLYEKELLDAVLTILGTVTVDDPDLGSDFEQPLFDAAGSIIFKTLPANTLTVQSQSDPHVAHIIPDYFYPLETRLKAANLLFAKVAPPGIDWSISARRQIATKLQSVASIDLPSFGGHPEFLEIRKRVFEAQELLKLLTKQA